MRVLGLALVGTSSLLLGTIVGTAPWPLAVKVVAGWGATAAGWYLLGGRA